MDINNNPPQEPIPGSNPGMPHRPMQPMARRPMAVDGFAPRRPMQPSPGMAPVHSFQPHPAVHPGVMPAVQPQPSVRPHLAHTPAPGLAASPPRQMPPHVPTPSPQLHPRPVGPPTVHQPTHAHSDFLASPRPTVQTATVSAPVPPAGEVTVSTDRPGREKSRTGHAGLVGFIVFVLLSALLLSPFVPGRIMNNFPFVSSSYATGNQSLDCIGTQGQMTSASKYNTKAGAPITYTYSTSTTQTATCNGQVQHAVAGSTSEFNSLGLLTDIIVALAAAIAVSRIWRLIFGEKRHLPRHREE